MSQDSAESNNKVTVLPQFMNDDHAHIDIAEEENSSWLSNNLHKLILGVSAVWIALVIIYITQFFGWSNLFLMMPDEFGGFMAGITLPLVIFWVAMAYIDRGTSFKNEARFLRAYMNQLVYPEEEAPQTAKAFADAIRSQVVELQQVTKLAHEQTSKIKDGIKENVDDFAKLVSKLDGYSSHTIVELSEGVKFLMSNFENIVAQAQNSSNNLASINQKFVEDSNMIGNSLSELLDKIMPSLQEIKNTVQELKQTANGAMVEINRSGDELKSFNQMAIKNFTDTQNILNAQIDVMGQVSEKAFENCDALKDKVAGELSDMQDVLQKHLIKIDEAITSVSQETKNKSEEIAKMAMDNVETINNGVRQSFKVVGEMFDSQIDKFDVAVNQYSHQISGLVKTIDERADVVTKKFSSHSELVNQELDKLMVRSANLEEGVAMRVANLKSVADEAIAAMQDVESSLTKNTIVFGEKVALANDDFTSYIDTINDDLTSYIDTINDKVVNIQDFSDKLNDMNDHINESYKGLQKVLSTGLEQLQGVNKDINSSTENLLVQTAQSSESLNQIASVLQKHTSGLADASNVVVTQSQISEASLIQQQKYLADMASKVDFIKDELRRQIDELSLSSDSLEKSAKDTANLLKESVQKMLASCNEAISKGHQINDNLAEQSNQFDTSINKTITKVTQFENVLTKQLQNIDGVSKKIDDRSENINKTLTACTQKLDDISTSSAKTIGEAVAEFNITAENINTVSKNAVEYIDNVAKTIDDKVTDLNVSFRQQEADFYSYSNKMSDNTANMIDAMKKQMNEISSDTDKIYAKMLMVEENTTNKADIVTANLQKSVQKISEIGKSLYEQQRKAVQSIDESMAKLVEVNDAVQSHIGGFSSKVKEFDGNIKESFDNFNITSAKLKSLQQDMIKESGQTWQKLNEQAKFIETTNAKIISQNTSISELFEQQKNDISEVVNSVITQARLGEAAMAQQYKYLTDTTVEVAAKMQDINNDFKNHTGDIFDTTNKLSYEFEVLGDRLLKACEAINKASKDSIKSVDQVNIRLSQCGEDLDVAIHQSVKNIGGVFNEYEKYISGFNTVTAETSTGVIEINNLISAQSDKMVKISDDTKKLVDCFNTILNDTSTQLATRANDAYDKVKDLGVKLKQLSNEMDDAARLSATHFEKSGDKLRAAVNEIASNAERISNNILASGEVFIKQSQALSTLADSTADKVNSSLNNLVSASKEFEERGQNIIKDSNTFNDNINNQIKVLSDNTTKAEKTMKGLSLAYRDVKVDTFIKDSTKIMKILENISVDINRLLNPKGEEDLWKKFYNGDTQIFIRTLAKNISNSQIAAMRKEFEKNSELRSLVIKYMNEFEALVEKSKDHEYAASLMAVISGSDLGRLYYILSKALNKIN